MRGSSTFTRLVLVGLAALLMVLPIVHTGSPVAAKGRFRNVTRTSSNATALDLPVSASELISASLYPSAITVGGLKRGRVRDVNVRLNNLTHDFPDDVEVLLMGPGGQTAVVMAHVGGVADVDDVSLRLDDEAAGPLPDGAMLQSGTFRPTFVENTPSETIVFNAQAPSAGTSTALSVFDGTNPDGTWPLFVQDLEQTDPGVFAGGWTLELTAKVKAKKKQ